MGEDIKSDLAGIAITHPFFAAMVTNALNYIEELEKENKNYKEYAVMMTTEGLLINGVKFNFNDYIPKSKVKEKMKKYEWSLNGYDSSTADYKHSQCIGRYLALQELLREE